MTKYIIFQNGLGLSIPMLFTDILTHSHVADAVKAKYPDMKPKSAEFIVMGDDHKDNLYVGGSSVSLGLNSKPEDKELILKMLTKTTS